MDTAVHDFTRERFLAMGERFGWFRMPLNDMIASLEKEISKRGDSETNKILRKTKSDYFTADQEVVHQDSDAVTINDACIRDVDDLNKDCTGHSVEKDTSDLTQLNICNKKEQLIDIDIDKLDFQPASLGDSHCDVSDDGLTMAPSEKPNAILCKQRITEEEDIALRTINQTCTDELHSYTSTEVDEFTNDNDNVWCVDIRKGKTLENPLGEICSETARQQSCNGNGGTLTESPLLKECAFENKCDQMDVSDSPVKASLTARLLKKYNPEKSQSDMDDFEFFLEKIKTPKQPIFSSEERRKKTESLGEFIVDDDNDNDGDLGSDLEVFYTPGAMPVEINDDNDSDNCIELEAPVPGFTPFKTPKSTSVSWRTPKSSKTKLNPASDAKKGLTPCHPSLGKNALDDLLTPYSTEKDFKKNKDHLVKELFELYNKTVFDNQLPSDFQITWNKKMRSTAGFCYYSKKNGVCVSRIELADKVIDSSDRLRDTLVHEMCHAAAWIISGVKAGHGPVWKQWTKRANFVHPTLPPISRCHSYTINAKFTYRCTNSSCGNSFGRHSKSVNLEKNRCSYCHGRLELAPQLKKDGTPQQTRTPSKFAMFVKENFARVKRDNGASSHQDVMRALSSEFAKLSSV